MSERVTARIQGDDYTIVGDTDPEYIKRLAELVDRKIRELHLGMPNASKLKLAVLAALNLADELEQARSNIGESAGPSSPEAEEKTRKLITLIEEGLIGDL